MQKFQFEFTFGLDAFQVSSSRRANDRIHIHWNPLLSLIVISTNRVGCNSEHVYAANEYAKVKTLPLEWRIQVHSVNNQWSFTHLK